MKDGINRSELYLISSLYLPLTVSANVRVFATISLLYTELIFWGTPQIKKTHSHANSLSRT